MQGPTDEASVPMKSYVIDSRILGVTMRRKNGIRTYPWSVASEENTTLPPPPPPLEVEGLPARQQAPTSFTTATTDGVTPDPSDDDSTPTDPVTLAALLPSAVASRAPRRNWKEEEDTKLTDAVKKYGKKWGVVASLVPGRTSNQCHQRWTKRFNQCHQRWTKRFNPIKGKKGNSRHFWKSEEDAKLTAAVKKHGKRWVAVAALFPGRTNQLCRQRWVNHLDPHRVSSTMEHGYIGNDEACV
jgi:hypothetical protein